MNLSNPKKQLSKENVLYNRALDLVDMGEKYFKNNEYENALKYYDKAIQTKPVVSAFIGKSKVYIALGKITEAKELIKEAQKNLNDKSLSGLLNKFAESIEKLN